MTMNLVDDPDETIDCPLAACCGCGADLAGAPVTAQRRHQVTDIEPAPAPKITEYLAEAKECAGCGTVTAGELPAHVRAPQGSGPTDRVSEFEVLYRANVAAVTAYFARRSADPQTVADLTADTFVQAITTSISSEHSADTIRPLSKSRLEEAQVGGRFCVVDMSLTRAYARSKPQRAASTRGLAQVTWVTPHRGASYTPLQITRLRRGSKAQPATWWTPETDLR
jgi:hypothetical protein